jgi:hypothetical protein
MMPRVMQRFKALNSDRIAAILFAVAVGFAIWLYGVLAHRNDLFPYPQLHAVLIQAQKGLTLIRGQVKPEDGWFFYRRPAESVPETHTYLPGAVSKAPVLVYGIDEDRKMAIRIIDNEGTVLHQWVIDIFALWPETDHIPERDRPKADPGGEIHGLVITSKGDIVFNFEPFGLIRLDYCGNPVWRLPAFTHHSVERDGDGGFIVSEQDYVAEPGHKDEFGNVETFREYVTFVSAQGKVLERISVNDLLLENGLGGLYYLAAHAPFGLHFGDNDLLHLNDAEIFPADLKPGVFGPGDILVSLRNLNTVIVFNRATRKIKYAYTGSFVMQHDPDFISGDEISLFDNHAVVKSDMNRRERPADVFSRIVILNARDKSERVFFQGSKEVPFFSDIMGKHQWLPNGNLLVTEARWGRVFELTPDGKLAWEYNNVLDRGIAEGLLGMVLGGLRLPAGLDRQRIAELGRSCASRPVAP